MFSISNFKYKINKKVSYNIRNKCAELIEKKITYGLFHEISDKTLKPIDNDVFFEIYDQVSYNIEIIHG